MREPRPHSVSPAPQELVALESANGDFVVLSFPIEARPADALTPSEVHVVELLLEGKSNAFIAGLRGTTARTVANQVASVFRKLGVCSRLELATAAPFLKVALPGETSSRIP